jgi:hypothetical protein
MRAVLRDEPMFRYESDLVSALRERPPSQLLRRTADFQLLAGVQVGMRIPDLLLFSGAPTEGWVPAKLSYFDCTIVSAAMDAGPLTVADLAERTYSAPHEISVRVNKLVRFGLLASRSGERFDARRSALPKIKIIAIEAKLSRWKEALAQAVHYLSFANESYVAMPATTIRRNIPALDACAREGVGVLAVDSLSTDVVLAAQPARPQSAEWVRVLSTCVGLAQSKTLSASRQAR